MKCPKCGIGNKDTAKFCKKCKFKFDEPGQRPVTIEIWRPNWKWHLKTLAVIYLILIATYFILNILLRPYMRKVPKEITPWLDSQKSESEKTK